MAGEDPAATPHGSIGFQHHPADVDWVDASRLVQLSSLALMLSLIDVLPQWSDPKRRILAIANLALPSIYVSTKALPYWGTGCIQSIWSSAN